MMDLAGIARRHQNLSRAWEVPQLTAVFLRSSEARTVDGDEVTTDFCGEQGWVRFRSSVRWTEDLCVDEVAAEGHAVRAEWFDGTRSWRLGPHPTVAGKILVQSFEEVTDGGVQADDLPLLRLVEGIMAERGSFLRYHVYWACRDDGSVQRQLATFRGFAETRR